MQMSNRDAECLLPQPGCVIRFLAHEIEVQLVDPPILGVVDGHLARDAVELTAAAVHHEVVVTALEIAPDPNAADAADLSVQANERAALDLASLRLEPALTPAAADPAAAVVGVEQLVLEDERVARALTR